MMGRKPRRGEVYNRLFACGICFLCVERVKRACMWSLGRAWQNQASSGFEDFFRIFVTFGSFWMD